MGMGSRHAYLVIAHNNFNLLYLLLQLIDDERNDIYIHIDKKVKDFDKLRYKSACKFSKIYFTNKRIDVQWGESSQVKTEMLLYKTASPQKYEYYHLISGVDLPLKSQNEIHDFFAKYRNREFIFFENEVTHWDYQRLSIYRFPKKWDERITNRLYCLQAKLKIDRIKRYNMVFYKGYNWCSLSHEAVSYLLENEKFIRRICKATSCADECYKQFLLCNSEVFKNRIYFNEKGLPDDLREVNWENCANSPHIYTIADLERLRKSDKIFARKFDEKVDFEVIRQIVSEIKRRG